MADPIAASEFGNEKLPNATSKEYIAFDAPNLLPLLSQSPHLKIITPSSPDFAKYNTVFQQDSPSKPLALVRPTTVQEVADIVRFASSACPPIPITVRGGGHDFWHRSNVTGALTVHLRELDELEVSSDKKHVTIGRGTIGFNLVRFLETHGLTVALGGCPLVGVTGWATCGGYGGLNGLARLGADQILEARMVAKSGEVVDADEETLWALRGGGCNFGVITSMTIKVYDIPKILAGLIVFTIHEAKNVLLGYQEILDQDFPDAFSRDLGFMNFSGAGHVLAFIFSWASSDFDAGLKYAEKIKGLGYVAMDTVAPLTQAAWMDASKDLAPPEIYTKVRSVYTPLRFSGPLIDLAVSHAQQISTSPDSKTSIIVHPCHGVGITPNPNSCFGKREPHMFIEILAMNVNSEDKNADYEWADALEKDFKEKDLVSTGAYAALTEPGRAAGGLEAFFGKNVERLREVKRKTDPGNVFSSVPSLV